jgi:hypothetical protein
VSEWWAAARNTPAIVGSWLAEFPFYRAKAGDYRIVFEIEGETLIIIMVDLRRDDEIYKALKRLYG